ncbi:unnamed protein product, partial [Ilex paraguariensis]
NFCGTKTSEIPVSEGQFCFRENYGLKPASFGRDSNGLSCALNEVVQLHSMVGFAIMA